MIGRGFYKMKAVIHFLRWGGSAPTYPPGWGCAPDPSFLQCHRELNRLTSHHTILKTSQDIILVNIFTLETHFLSFFVNPYKYIISKNSNFLHSVKVIKSFRIYHLQNKKYIKIYLGEVWMSPREIG